MELVDDFSTIDFSNLPKTISEFFTAKEFAAMPEYEKQHLSNIRQNFEALKRAGLPVKPPEFMVKNKSERERKKMCALPLSDISDNSDEEWIPVSKKKKKRVAQFKPPKQARPTGQNLVSEPTKKIHRAASRDKNGKGKKQINYKEDVKEAHVYPFRTKRATSFMSMMIPEDDDFLYCEECNIEYLGDCPDHGPLNIIGDSAVPKSYEKGKDPEYCRKTLPEGLEIRKSKIPKAGLGVFATKFFPVRSRFGPYSGKKETDWLIAFESGYCWQVIRDEKTSHYVDASDPKESNWMRFVNCARSEEEQCLTAYQHQGEVYYRAHKEIHPGMELLVYYGDNYARDLGIKTQCVGGLKLPQDIDSLTKRESIVSQISMGDKKHEKENKTGLFQCHWCPYEYFQQQDCQRHMKRAHDAEYTELLKRQYSCSLKQSQALEIIKQLRTDQYMGCSHETINFCPENESLSSSLSNVNETEHKEIISQTMVRLKKSPKCYEHSKSLTTQQRDAAYECDVCGMGFAKSSQLSIHQKVHSGEKPYKCDVCGKGFAQSGELSRHKRVHSGEKPYKCDVCGKGFAQDGHLSTHKRIHSGDKPYKCDVCGKGFAQDGHLSTHKRIHSGEKPYKCDVCGKGFAQSNNLSIHKRVHSGEKPYKCDVCGKGFARSGDLSTHKRVHSGEKPYKCDVCGKGFAQDGHLSTHKRIHSGEKPYKCDVCGKGFARSDKLSIHKRVHSGEKPYKCDVCGKGFAQSNNLSIHKRVHSGEKPYKCDVCGKGFAQSDKLSIHKRVHSGEKC